MESVEPRPVPPPRPPWVVLIAMGFLVYATFVALPLLILGSPSGQTLTAVQVGLSFAAFLALFLWRRRRLTFHLARAALALWAARGVYAAWRMVAAPWYSASARTQPATVQVLMLLGVGGLCALFWFYAFGRRSREFYRT